jgi:hypothetical protein
VTNEVSVETQKEVAVDPVPDVRFKHWPEQRLTMAVVLLADGDVAVGLAKAGRRDQWSRALGRAIAEGRARCHRGTHHRFILINAGLVDTETVFVHWEAVLAEVARVGGDRLLKGLQS